LASRRDGGGCGGAVVVDVGVARRGGGGGSADDAVPVAVRRHDADEGVRRRAGVGDAVGGTPAALRAVRRDPGGRRHRRPPHRPLQGLRIRDVPGGGGGAARGAGPEPDDRRPPRQLQHCLVGPAPPRPAASRQGLPWGPVPGPTASVPGPTLHRQGDATTAGPDDAPAPASWSTCDHLPPFPVLVLVPT
ncbi:Os06g0220600, partial [Oryza sativa Japonica Group]